VVVVVVVRLYSIVAGGGPPSSPLFRSFHSLINAAVCIDGRINQKYVFVALTPLATLLDDCCCCNAFEIQILQRRRVIHHNTRKLVETNDWPLGRGVLVLLLLLLLLLLLIVADAAAACVAVAVVIDIVVVVPAVRLSNLPFFR
jgi:hypothetical protein